MELFFVLIIPALAAGLCALPTRRRVAPAWTLLSCLAVMVLAARVALSTIRNGDVVALPQWISCGSFGALILLLVAFVGFTASVFSLGYIGQVVPPEKTGKIRRYYARFNLFLLSMLAVPVLAHVALVWIAVELTTLLSVFLVSFEDTPEALEAAWKYVVLTCMGAAFALVGVLFLYWGMKIAGQSDFTWSGLVAASTNIPPRLLKTAFLFILVGFGTKAGLVPVHTWLPDAHSQAPSPVCALLSGVETTTVLYAIIRLLPVLQESQGHIAGRWFIGAGLLSAGAAAFLLLQVKDYKRLFAFSTVEHMGIILFAAGLGGVSAHYGASFQIVAHSVSKAFCFFAAGSVLLALGRRDIASVRGLLRTSRPAALALLVGGLAIAGAPPFAVFLGEFSILRAGIEHGQFVSTILLTFFLLIAFCGIMYHINGMVFGSPVGEAIRVKLPASSLIALGISAIPVLLLGVYVPGTAEEMLRLVAGSLGR
jgi:hydrogenase-4 component F